jgi:predicted metal-dependent peptidase
MRHSGILLPVIQGSRPLPRPRIAVGFDTSGSIYDDTILARFTREVASVLEHANAEVLLLVADAEVHQTLELRGNDGIQRLRNLTYQGGGGTDFAPAIAAASAWKPRAMIYFTDLAGSAGPTPSFPVLWAVPESFGAVTAPFGTLLRIDG